MKKTEMLKKNYEFKEVLSKGKYYSGSYIEAFIQNTKSKNEINYLLISVSKNTEKEIKRFEERLKKFKIEFKLSTQTVEIDGNSFLLTNNTLRMPNEEIRGFAGTLCVIDTTTLKWKRIYLDLFPDIHFLLCVFLIQLMLFFLNLLHLLSYS